jgi:sulfate transporter 4
MDAFAENQMGRNSSKNSSMVDLAALEAAERRKKTSKEAMEMGVEEQAAEELLPIATSPERQDKDDDVEVEVAGMSLQESTLIARRWERRKSMVMPVADPYAEPAPGTSYAQRVLKELCTARTLAGHAKRAVVGSLPPFEWGPLTTRQTLKADVIAGLTVGVMLIPQSMSYANIAGLQYKYGLYTSVVPIITYALLGTSRQLGVGPVAMVSLLVEVGLKGALTEAECPEYYAQSETDLPKEDWLLQSELCPDQYAQLAFLTSFLVGIFQIAAGIFRLGFLVSFLAHPVISGFTSAAAIIIGLSQLQYFMGFKIPKSQYVYETFIHLGAGISQTKYEQLLLGLTWWFMLWASRKLSIKYKKRLGWLKPSAPLITCILAIIVGGNLELFNGCGFQNGATEHIFSKCDPDAKNKLVVGTIPSGLASMGSIHLLDMSRLSVVLSSAISCAIIGFMESIAISKALAAKHKYEIDAGQELKALGVANLLGSFTSAYPVTGSFSRSAVNNQTGAQTQLAGMVTGLLLLITLVALTPIFYFLPKYALAAIVIASVTNLIDYNEAIHLWKIKKPDFLLWCVAFFGTLFLGVQIGLLLAIGVSLALVIVESVRPQMTVLWKLPNTSIWRNIKQESSGHFVPGVMVVRVGSSMYFANVAYIRDYISKMIGEFSEAANYGDDTSVHGGASAPGPKAGGGAALTSRMRVTPEPIKYIVMEMTPVTSVDSTALHMLEDMHRDLKERGIRLALSTVGDRVEDTLIRSGLIEKMGEQWIFPTVHVAVQHCIRHKMRGGSSTDEMHTAAIKPAAENNTAEETDRGAYSTDDSPPSSTSGDKDEPQAKTKEIEQLRSQLSTFKVGAEARA